MCGHQVQLDYKLDPNNDLNIYFMGARPVYKFHKFSAKEIHEYHSLSIPPYAKLKDKFKRIINKKPDGRIFLNDYIRENLSYNDEIPYIYRDMGVDNSLFQEPNANPDYDILYCGSISGRVGLIKALLTLSERYKLIVVGQLTEDEKILLDNINITIFGRAERSELPAIYKNARYGLNYTPDVYPFNIQTSTKTLEYLAAGLHVISNHYKWIDDFSKEINYVPIWLDDCLANKTLYQCDNLPEMDRYKWSNLLGECRFNDYLIKIVNK
nr:glycosyl transferase [uncultured Psychrobacter sp.]